MIVTFLGTGAAQGVPPVFARNKYFEYIRKTKGKELRSKASLRLGKFSQIDFGPDSNWQNIRFGMDMYDVRNLFITHSHSDHFSYFELFEIYSMAYEIPEDCPGHSLNLYLSKPAYNWIYDRLLPIANVKKMTEKIIAKPLDYYKGYSCGNMSFETIKASHKSNGIGENAINYFFKSNAQKTLLYALDTGIYPDETFEYLSGKKADTVIMECTFGDSSERGSIGDGHLNLETLNMQVERLADIGFLSEKTPIYISHISPVVAHKYEDFQELLSRYDYNYILSYDGMSFEFEGE